MKYDVHGNELFMTDNNTNFNSELGNAQLLELSLEIRDWSVLKLWASYHGIWPHKFPTMASEWPSLCFSS